MYFGPRAVEFDTPDLVSLSHVLVQKLKMNKADFRSVGDFGPLMIVV